MSESTREVPSASSAEGTRLGEIPQYGGQIRKILDKQQVSPQDVFPFIRNLSMLRQRLIERGGGGAISHVEAIQAVDKQIKFGIVRDGTMEPVSAYISLSYRKPVGIEKVCKETYQVEREGKIFKLTHQIYVAGGEEGEFTLKEIVTVDSKEYSTVLKGVLNNVWEAHLQELGHDLEYYF